jgi:hypothetical protein
VAAAELMIPQRRDELAQVEALLARSRDEEPRIHAKYTVDRAHDHVAVAEGSLLTNIEASVSVSSRYCVSPPGQVSESR